MTTRPLVGVLLTLMAMPVEGAIAQDAAGPPTTLAPVFTDHMVLQRGKPVTVWGQATSGTQIEVIFGQQLQNTTADQRNDWSVTLPAMPAERIGRNLFVRARLGRQEETLTLRDVVCGDVWLCTGQSNMRWRVEQSAEAKEVLATADLPDLRLLDFEGRLYPSATEYSVELLQGLTAANYYTANGWKRASADSASSFSAVAFAFGRRVVHELQIPIGLVHNAIGGAPMEAFLPPANATTTAAVRRAIQDWWTSPDYPAWCRQRLQKNLAAWFTEPRGARPHHPFEPSFLFAAGIEPLRQFPVQGVLWYQGESNATGDGPGPALDPARNRKVFEALIRGFRDAWSAPELPFYFVQLPGMQRDWELFREMQLRVAQTTPNTGMAITIDLGHPTDVHPRRKVPVGERLARLALARTYGRPVVPSGPLLGAHEIDGRSVVLRFDHAAGLRTLDGKPARGFAVAGADRRFHPALATIDGQTVVVRAAAVDEPIAVRYAFTDDPDTNLINGARLPASPFRTDRWQDPRAPARDTGDSFEESKVGALRDLVLSIGRLEAAEGHAEITDRFAHSGRQCLHIVGGVDRMVTLTANELGGTQLSFWAERWTRRAPFAFRIEARRSGRWLQIYDGDAAIRVGRRFLSHVRIAVPAKVTALRFRCTSPDASGVLIDDLQLEQPKPMRILGAQHAPWVAPILHPRDNAIADVSIPTVGSLSPLSIAGCTIEFADDTDLTDLANVHLYHTATATPDTRQQFGDTRAPRRRVTFAGQAALHPGQNHLWVCVDRADDADLDHRVTAHVVEVILSDGSELRPQGRGSAQRIGLTVRAAGQDDCHTYRIPGLATSNAGTLIAVYDNRYRGSGDLPGDIDVGMSRSTDGGRTWQSMRVIMDMGDDPKFRFDGIGDPAVLVDRNTGTIWVAATWSHGNRSWRGSGPGMTPDETGQLMLVRSDDDGLTWSQPINITEQVKNPAWRFVLQGPGAGITMRDGTLVFAAQYRSSDDSAAAGKPSSTLISSQDRGKTWRVGTAVKVDTTEAQVVELGDGKLMLNCRDNRGGARSVYTTTDLGRTWRVHPSSRHALIEPVCMGSLLRVDHEQLGTLLLFSNPATTSGRFDMTLKISQDEGRTWPPQAHTLYDQRPGSGYSCLTRIDDEHVGVLYEGRRELHFLRFAIRDLLNP